MSLCYFISSTYGFVILSFTSTWLINSEKIYKDTLLGINIFLSFCFVYVDSRWKFVRLLLNFFEEDGEFGYMFTNVDLLQNVSVVGISVYGSIFWLVVSIRIGW